MRGGSSGRLGRRLSGRGCVRRGKTKNDRKIGKVKMKSITEDKAAFLAGLFIAMTEASKGGVSFADAFTGAFEHRETETFEGTRPHRRRIVYREMSKVEEVLNRAKRERLVDGCVCHRQCIIDEYANDVKQRANGSLSATSLVSSRSDVAMLGK